MKKLILSAIAASFLAVGCAEPQAVANSGAGGPIDDGDVLTGSRLPRKTRQNAEGTKTVNGSTYKTESMGRDTIGNAPRGN